MKKLCECVTVCECVCVCAMVGGRVGEVHVCVCVYCVLRLCAFLKVIFVLKKFNDIVQIKREIFTFDNTAELQKCKHLLIHKYTHD